jgi:hypothetical protein
MNRNVTIGLVIIFGLLLLYVLLVQMPQDQAKANLTPTAAPSRVVWQVQTEQIAGVRIVDHAQNHSVALVKDAAGTWAITEPTPQAADSAQIPTVLYRFTGLAIGAEITSATNLAPYGVLSPTYSIDLTTTDGRHLKADVGGVSPTGVAYYVMRPGEDTVLLVSKGSLDSIFGLIAAPPIVLPTPTQGFATPLPVP